MRLRSSTGRLSPGGGVVLALASALVVLATSCSSGGSNAPPTYSVFVQKFRYHNMPTSIPSGNLTINFSNRENLSITHEMVVVSLPSGKKAQDVIDAAKAEAKPGDSEDQWLHFGEIGEVDTGATISGVFDLPAGTYAMACWQHGNLGGGEGKSHASRGMVFQFTVS
ncbi:MAG: hypothetical protein ACJ77A_08065 [Actinomycetota bacterium]